MLEIAETTPTENDISEIAPEVFIDSVHVTDTKIKVFYHIEDQFSKWLDDQSVLENLYINIEYGDQKYYKKLISIKNTYGVKNKLLNGIAIFQNNTGTSTLTAYINNRDLKGITTTEKVLTSNIAEKASIGTTNYQFINKIIDLRLLDFNITTLAVPSVDETSPTFNNRIFVSNTTNKKANIGFLFDLEEFLEKNSSTYRFLKQYKTYKDSILNQSLLKVENISFFKKNVSLNNQEYQKIMSPITLIRLDDSNYKYLITTSDDNTNILNTNLYKLGVSVEVEDYSSLFFKSDILTSLQNSKNYIEYYISKIDAILQNDSLQNPYHFFFENMYEEELASIEKVIESLANIYSFYSLKDKNIYYSLLLNIFHPLTTNVELLNLLLDRVSRLYKASEQFIEQISLDTTPNLSIVVQNNLSFKKEFNENINNQAIDYRYDVNTGYEVISSDSYSVRTSETSSSLMIITKDERNTRKILEDGKTAGVSRVSNTQITGGLPQFSQPNTSTVFPRSFTSQVQYSPGVSNKQYSSEVYQSADKPTTQYLSISSIDINGNSTYLLDGLNTQDIGYYNNLFININQYNSDQLLYATPESYFFSILDKNVNVKTIADSKNNSANSLQKTTLFDPNLDSKQESLNFITSTGVESLYFYLDDNNFIPVSEDIKKINFVLTPGTASTNSTLSEDIKTHPEIKPKMIVLYNNFFEETEIYAGLNYGLYYMKEKVLNSIFKKKLKHFNQFYVIQFKENVTPSAQQATKPFIDELNYNYPTKYLNRTVTESQILITTDDL